MGRGPGAMGQGPGAMGQGYTIPPPINKYVYIYILWGYEFVCGFVGKFVFCCVCLRVCVCLRAVCLCVIMFDCMFVDLWVCSCLFVDVFVWCECVCVCVSVCLCVCVRV